MLRGKTIEIAVDTRTADDKLRIGFIKLAIPTSKYLTHKCYEIKLNNKYINNNLFAGDFGIIDIDQSQHCTDDPELWKKFLNKPEDMMEVHVPLYPTDQVKRNSPQEFNLSTPPIKRKRSKQVKAKK